VQSTAGLFTASVVYAVALGGVFAMVFAVAYGRVGRLGPRSTAALTGLAGFVAVALVPWLKYPANPPATGDPDTIDQRTSLYLLMVVIALAAVALAIYTGRSQAARLGAWNAALAGAGVFVLVVTVAYALLPAVAEVPEGFSSVLLWNFRLASLGTQLVIWSTLGLGFGTLVDHGLRRSAGRTATSVAGSAA
jgi:predicted cobalt transporter CbtA